MARAADAEDESPRHGVAPGLCRDGRGRNGCGGRSDPASRPVERCAGPHRSAAHGGPGSAGPLPRRQEKRGAGRLHGHDRDGGALAAGAARHPRIADQSDRLLGSGRVPRHEPLAVRPAVEAAGCRRADSRSRRSEAGHYGLPGRGPTVVRRLAGKPSGRVEAAHAQLAVATEIDADSQRLGNRALQPEVRAVGAAARGRSAGSFGNRQIREGGEDPAALRAGGRGGPPLARPPHRREPDRRSPYQAGEVPARRRHRRAVPHPHDADRVRGHADLAGVAGQLRNGRLAR